MVWSDYLTLKLLNTLLVLWATAADVFVASLTLPPADSKCGYGLGKDTLVTPSPWIYLVLILVHLGFLGTVAFIQWTDEGKEIVLKGLKLRFPFMLALSIAFTTAWVRHMYIVAFIISVFLAITTSHMYLSLKREHTRDPGLFNTSEEIFVHVPFSLYHGWTVFMAVITFIAAVFPTSSHASIVSKIFSIWALACLVAVSFSYALPGRMIHVGSGGDPAGSLVITLGLWAIFAHQHWMNKWAPPPDERNYRDGEIVTWFALAFAIISTWATAWGIWVYAKAARPNRVFLAADDDADTT